MFAKDSNAGFEITQHAGWSKEDRKRIDSHVNQAQLFDEQDKSPLEARASSARTSGAATARVCCSDLMPAFNGSPRQAAQ